MLTYMFLVGLFMHKTEQAISLLRLKYQKHYLLKIPYSMLLILDFNSRKWYLPGGGNTIEKRHEKLDRYFCHSFPREERLFAVFSSHMNLFCLLQSDKNTKLDVFTNSNFVVAPAIYLSNCHLLPPQQLAGSLDMMICSLHHWYARRAYSSFV